MKYMQELGLEWGTKKREFCKSLCETKKSKTKILDDW